MAVWLLAKVNPPQGRIRTAASSMGLPSTRKTLHRMERVLQRPEGWLGPGAQYGEAEAERAGVFEKLFREKHWSKGPGPLVGPHSMEIFNIGKIQGTRP